MNITIAKIVKSNSHIDYVGRVIDSLDVENPPTSDDYGFAQFVSLPLEDGEEVIGVIYNSMLRKSRICQLWSETFAQTRTRKFQPGLY